MKGNEVYFHGGTTYYLGEVHCEKSDNSHKVKFPPNNMSLQIGKSVWHSNFGTIHKLRRQDFTNF